MIDFVKAEKQVKTEGGYYYPVHLPMDSISADSMIEFIFDCKYFFTSPIIFMLSGHKKNNSFSNYDTSKRSVHYCLSLINLKNPTLSADVMFDDSIPKNVLLVRQGDRFIGMLEINNHL